MDRLRPPTLDLRLATVLCTEMQRFMSPSLSVRIDVPRELGRLAVEVAAYRIVIEVLANVAKHARVTMCLVIVRERRVEDDGRGVHVVLDDRRGVGLN